MAQSNSYQFAFTEESVYGTTPVDPVLTIVPVTGSDLARVKDIAQSTDINESLQANSVAQTAVAFTGNVTVELRSVIYNTLIAAALRSDLPDPVVNGTATPSFTIEELFQDTGEYRVWRGMRVGTMSLQADVGSLVTAEFEFVGLDEVTNAVGVDIGDGERVAASNYTPWSAASDAISIRINGLPTTVCVQGFGISVFNSLRNNFCVGELNPVATAYGPMVITGTLNGVFDVWDELHDAFVNNTPVSLAFSFTGEEGSNLTFLLPLVYITEGAVNPHGINTEVDEVYAFQAAINAWGQSIRLAGPIADFVTEDTNFFATGDGALFGFYT